MLAHAIGPDCLLVGRYQVARLEAGEGKRMALLGTSALIQIEFFQK